MLRAALGGVVAALVLAASAGSQSAPPEPWDGANPFACELQQAGFEAEVPNPDADPYCVEFDKTRQNVTELGVVEFLSKEPARVAAAGDKCFYFQSDHWRGSIVQEDGTTKTYEWDGHYFFDKAKAEGGVWVTNFNVNGETQDPSQLPGMPAEYAQHFGPGTGGMITHNEVEADPACVEKARAQSPYAAPAEGEGSPARPRCVAAAPVRRRSIGPVRLGTSEAELRAALGAPAGVARGFLRYCAEGGGRVLVGVAGDRTSDDGGASPRPVRFVVTTSRASRFRGVGPGTRSKRRAGVVRVRRGVLAVVRARRVRLLAIYDAGRVERPRAWLRRATNGG